MFSCVGNKEVGSHLAFDSDVNGTAAIDELLAAVNVALGRCT